MGQRPNPRFYQAPEGQAYCSGCDSYKSNNEFSDHKRTLKGQYAKCKACVKALNQIYKGERVFKDKEKNYGISARDYIALLDKQGHVCAICGEPETKTVKGTLASFSVDHDHETGKIRGLLCSSCNAGIGHLRDDVELLRAAIDYLAANDAKPKRKKHDVQRVSQGQTANEGLRRMAHGLSKQMIGSESDIENLPLFTMN